MRGFNLFAAFLGTAMILIAIAYSTYMGQQRQERIHKIAEDLVRFDTAGVSAVIKADAYNTILAKIREEFQDFFATNVVDPPACVWDNSCSNEEWCKNGGCSFEDWFVNEFSHSDALTAWIADRMLNELEAYTELDIFGEDYDVYVVGNVKEVTDTIKKASKIVINDDGTFTYILDTENLSKEDYENLPKLHVRKVGEISGETTDVVIPRGVWRIPVRLRVVTAFQHAKSINDQIKSRVKDIAIAVGHCDEDNPQICGYFRANNDEFVLIAPNRDKAPSIIRSNEEEVIKANIVSPCQYQSVKSEDLIKGMNIDFERYGYILYTSLKAELEAMKENGIEGEETKKIEELLNNLKSCCKDREKTCPEDCIKSVMNNSELQWTSCRGDTGLALAAAGALLRDIQEKIYPLDDWGIELLPDPTAYKKYETAKIIRRTGINLLRIICNELTGTVELARAAIELILRLFGIKAEIGGESTLCQQASNTGSDIWAKFTISFDTCTVSGSVYCAAPTRVSYLVRLVDNNEKYRVKNEPAEFWFRVRVKKLNGIKEKLENREKQVELVTVKTGKKTPEEKKEICQSTLSAAKDYLPGIIAGCLQQYTRVSLKCTSSLNDDNISRILAGINETDYLNWKFCVVDKRCENTSSNTTCQKFCEQKSAEDQLKGMCYQLIDARDKGYGVPTIPGVLHGKDYVPNYATAYACISANNLDSETKTCLEEKGIKPQQNGYYCIFANDEAVNCLQGDTKQLYEQKLSENLENMRNLEWYCDKYENGWLDKIPGLKQITEKAGGLADWIEDKVKKAMNIACDGSSKNLEDIAKEECADFDVEDPKEVAKKAMDISKNLPKYLICTFYQSQGAKEANMLVFEYNRIYHNVIWDLIEDVNKNGWGRCGKDDPELQALVQAFAEPKEIETGSGQTISVGGNCHPQHILDQALQIAAMQATSIPCDLEDWEKKYILFETTWMHIGSDIYSSCSVGEAKP